MLVTFDPALLASEGTTVRRLGRIAPLFVSGPASTEMSARLRVRRLDGDLIEAARIVARMPTS